MPIEQLTNEIKLRFDGRKPFMLCHSPADKLPQSRKVESEYDSDIALLQRTSGTTGRPREFAFTRSAVASHARATADALGIKQNEQIALAITPGTAYYLSVLMMAVFREAKITVINPLRIREAVTQIKLEDFKSLDAGVRFWQTIEHLAEWDPSILSALRNIPIRGVGGDLLPQSTELFFQMVQAPLTNGYGLTQAGPNVAIDVRGPTSTLGSCGEPLPGVELSIVNRELLVRTPFLATAEIIQNKAYPIPELTEQGWLRTGDRAVIIDRKLVPQGRLSQSNGEKK